MRATGWEPTSRPPSKGSSNRTTSRRKTGRGPSKYHWDTPAGTASEAQAVSVTPTALGRTEEACSATPSVNDKPVVSAGSWRTLSVQQVDSSGIGSLEVGIEMSPRSNALMCMSPKSTQGGNENVPCEFLAEGVEEKCVPRATASRCMKNWGKVSTVLEHLESRPTDPPEEAEPSARGAKYLVEAFQGSRTSSFVPPQELRLWIAAREGRPSEVKAAIEAGARVDWELPENHPLTLVYKNRKVNSNSLHAAACFQGEGPCPLYGWPQARECVRLLLQARADPKANARVSADLYRRMLQAIHIAAGVGNTGVIRLLVESNADPDAAAISDDKVHYLPIHDAVWFNRLNSVKCLIEQRASVTGVNMLGQTALHLAAKLGYVSLAAMLLEQAEGPELVEKVDKEGGQPFDHALKCGQFPPRELGIFILQQTPEERAKSFMKVAENCPAAAPTLLRSRVRGDDGMGEELVDDEWRSVLQSAARNDAITFRTLASLIRQAPQAAMDLMDILTDTPEVKDQQHHPLPIRARLPPNNPCAMSYAYEWEDDWQWSPLQKAHGGGQPWHDDFAPLDAKRGHEVRIRVLKLPGVAGAEVLSSMAETTDLRLFTKLAVHALLMFAWRRLQWIFVAGLVHEVLASFVICFWIWTSDGQEPSYAVQRLLWSVVASQGIVDLALTLLAAFRCWWILGLGSFFGWYAHSWFRIVVDVSTVVLAHNVKYAEGPADDGQHWPSSGSEDSAILAVSSLFHGVHLLYQLRAFQWSGQRLLPIMKSVQPIAGMLVIMLFLIVSFLNAYWALDRGGSGRDGDLRVFDVVIFLLTGEGFLQSSDMETMEGRRRAMSIIVTVFASFLFIAIALNVFIAVLSDCYDQEQERMVCTFLKERATICTSLFLSPSWDFLGVGTARRHPAVKKSSNAIDLDDADLEELEEPGPPEGPSKVRNTGIVVFALALIGGAAGCLISSVSSWIGAMLLSAGLLLMQVQLRYMLTIGWPDRHLWLCHDVNVDEDMFLAPAGDQGVSTVETYGRIAAIKRYIHDQCRGVATECAARVATVQQPMCDLQEEMSALRAEVRDLTAALAQATGSAAVQQLALSQPSLPAASAVHRPSVRRALSTVRQPGEG